jgi:hypothetical protein
VIGYALELESVEINGRHGVWQSLVAQHSQALPDAEAGLAGARGLSDCGGPPNPCRSVLNLAQNPGFD